MPERIDWTLSVQVVGGPRLSGSQALTVDAYDKLDVSIEAGADNVVVELQPGGEGQVRFLLVGASRYGADLTYRVNSDTADPVALDAQQLLVGDGAVGLLGEAPERLLFSNGGEDATIRILVGRNATITS